MSRTTHKPHAAPPEAPSNAVFHHSLVVLSGADGHAQAPVQCLQACLHGDARNLATHGCDWLIQAASGTFDPSLLRDGCCKKSFLVDGQRIVLHGSPTTLISVRGEAPTVVDAFDDALESLDLGFETWNRIRSLVDENEALAEEVLQNYEQVNLLFDTTKLFSQVTQADDVERLMMMRLSELLGATVIDVVDADRSGKRYSVAKDHYQQLDADADTDVPASLVEKVIRSQAVSVRSLPNARLIAGPLARLESSLSVVIARRPPEMDDYTAGDMRLMESVLAFAGQIISNNELHGRLREMSIEASRELVAAIDQKDHYTCGHSERVGFLSRLTGETLGLSPNELELLEWAGLLHDVGKIGIPEEILNKPGRLTDDEFAMIKKHPEMGYEILKPISHFQHILDGVLFHHENPDGSGYPRGLTRDEIPMFARIIHVVDVFDALSSARSYREAFRAERALQIVREESGTKLDEEVVPAFLTTLERYRTRHPEHFADMFLRGRPEVGGE
ncbi:MAG: HD-GYP domain-containing protein [Dehalococcoidia bacterium]